MFRSIASQAAGAAFNAAAGFLLLIFLGRWLPPAEFASYVALLSAAAVALVAIAGGNPLWLYREGVTGLEALRPRLGLAVAQVLLACALLATAAWLLRGTAALLAMLCAGALALAEFVSAQLRAQGRFAREALWQVAMRLATAAAITGMVVFVARDAGSIFLAWLLATVVMLATVARVHLVWPRFAQFGPHLALVLPIVGVEALLALATKGDMAVLSVRFSAGELAHYAACTRFNEAAILAFAPLSNVQMHYLRLQRGNKKAFSQVWLRALAAALGFGALAIGASAVAGEWVVRALFGTQYQDAGALLVWVALALPFMLANMVLAQALVAAGQERRLALALCAGVATWLTALLLGAQQGLRGAAVAAALSHAGLALGLGLLLLRERGLSLAVAPSATAPKACRTPES